VSTVVGQVRLEHHREPLGIGESRPRISWKVKTDHEAWQQQAYEIAIQPAGGQDGSEESSGKVDSTESVLVAWPFHPLPSRARRTVRVRVWGALDGAASEWSEPADVETGLLEPTDWTAKLVSPDWQEDTSVDQPPALFRCEFEAAGGIASARLYVTAHGLFEAEINGTVVGEDVLAPGWSSYRHRLRYHTYDVTELIQTGANAIGATVADGWFRGLVGFEGGKRNIYGDQLALLAQLEIR
jgi:alpha-L-rhamnosidase